jgi:hypothetical protein
MEQNQTIAAAAVFAANPVVEHAVNLLRQRNAVKAKNPRF